MAAPSPSPKASASPILPTKPFKVPALSYSLVLISSLGFGFTVLYTYQSYRVAIRAPLPSSHDIAQVNATLSDTWKDEARASSFDDELESFEYWSGIAKRRRQLCSLARGDVLESAVGTGRNVGYYDASRVRSLTMVDQSRALVEICRGKWEDEVERATATAKANDDGSRVSVMPPARFLVGDLRGEQVGHVLRPESAMGTSQVAGEEEEEEEEKGKFDTVVQTMGLCSTPDPVKFLDNLGQVVKQDGRILLLEHGASHYDWLNSLLNHTALDHAKKHGCWWNRDIGGIIEESGLIVEEIKRYNFGTTWWIILRPKAPEKRSIISSIGVGTTQSKWWHVW